MTGPKIIELKSFGSDDNGHLTVLEIKDDIPFIPQRLYWVYGIKDNTRRGSHAHIYDRQVLVCVNGQIEVRLESVDGESSQFLLEEPTKGLYIPGRYWREITYGEGAVLLVISSEKFANKDYIRNYEQFRALRDERA